MVPPQLPDNVRKDASNLRKVTGISKPLGKKSMPNNNAAIKAAIAKETGLDVDNSYDKTFDESMEHSDTIAPPPRSTKASDETVSIPLHTTLGEVNESINTDVRHVIIKSADAQHPFVLTHIDPHTLGDELESIITEYKQCKILRSGSLLVEVDTLEKVKTLLSLEILCSHDVQVELATLVGTVRGVIFDKRYANKSEEYLLDKLCDQDVVKVRQIKKNEEPTPLFILTFKADRLPKNIKLKHEWKTVRPYNIRPQQCKKCYRFGHWATACTRQEVCSNCGIEGENHGTTCNRGTKCCLCGGSHKATEEKICPFWMKQTEIAEIRSKHQIGYKQAADVYQRKHNTRPMSAVGKSWDHH